jgi:hypothetical protein
MRDSVNYNIEQWQAAPRRPASGVGSPIGGWYEL